MILLQAGGDSAAFVQMAIFAAIFLVFYFFFIRPQSKKQKEQDNFASQLSKGDEVVTNSGMIGKINKIEDKVVSLQVDQKTFIRVLRSAISKEWTDSLSAKNEK